MKHRKDYHHVYIEIKTYNLYEDSYHYGRNIDMRLQFCI